ncbi:uncharacterized protein PGTG_05158 [Puccinia graminis f. sp. tritici CRL 75-36-700-3]|uniref:Uncharacterized protein n=1 Tax=Puccinia graminis f. sp. tritici (strain CRL 75-36-700-3 / race SCCL) TaxID=418459 RepID=E3K6T3_PUCGT|nr:uncharacterized protein PGTG_05158 [Puccinia graminis f. sp. tritici CRL 75-36-700-3]EFP79933.1 hypothetical protein PGTG_05158 [Puccinia graminis f. sp. tritici CRL 75-36-700-3]
MAWRTEFEENAATASGKTGSMTRTNAEALHGLQGTRTQMSTPLSNNEGHNILSIPENGNHMSTNKVTAQPSEMNTDGKPGPNIEGSKKSKSTTKADPWVNPGQSDKSGGRPTSPNYTDGKPKTNQEPRFKKFK